MTYCGCVLTHLVAPYFSLRSCSRLAHMSFNRDPGWLHYVKRLSSAIPSEFSYLMGLAIGIMV
jgi:hypothetical protein